MRRGVSVSLGRGRPRRGVKTGVSAHGSSAPSRAPQAVSSVCRAYSRQGPHQRRATFAYRSVDGASSRVCMMTAGSRAPGRRTVPGQSRRPPACPEPAARFPYIRAGKSWTNPREGFSREGRGRGARDLPGLLNSPPRTGTRRWSKPDQPLFLGYPLAGVPYRFLVPPSPQGRGKEAQPARPPERGPPLRASCARDAPPSRAKLHQPCRRPTGSHTIGLGRVGQTLGRVFQGREEGGEPGTSPGSARRPPEAGFSALARPLFEPPSRGGDLRVAPAESFP